MRIYDLNRNPFKNTTLESINKKWLDKKKISNSLNFYLSLP
jgi:hypothetical protein